MRFLLLASAFTAAIAVMVPTHALGGVTDLRRDDRALIDHIKTTDDVFTKVLGKCSGERLTRGKSGQFTYSGMCQISPSPETDCQRYKVTASGTVDSETWATVRDIRLGLQCSA